MPLNFYTKCRCCLSEEQEMHYLFKELDQGFKLSDILRSTTYFDIEENDGLSPYMCESCTTIVIDFFNFKAVYLENNNSILSLSNNEKNAFENEELKEIKGFKAEFTTETNNSSNVKSDKDQIISTNATESNLNEVEELDITGEFIEPSTLLQKEICYYSDENVEVFKYSCEECGESFSLKSKFKQHMMKSHNITACDFQKYISETSIKLPTITNLDLEAETIILQCDMCDENFKTCAEIEDHYKTHKKYICELCGAGFLKKSYLNDHAEIHTTEKKHVCPMCGKAFRRRTVLAKHKRIHTHPRRYVCEVCGLRFTDKGTLKTHIKLKHTKERNFNCMICGLWFPLKSTLMKHIHRHNERKREHICEVCHMAYKDKSSLTRHVLIKHTENAGKPSCLICGKEYTTNTNLLKHVRQNHKSVNSKNKTDENNDEITDAC